MDLGVEELEKGLLNLEKELRTATSKVDKTMPEHVLSSVIAFARMLDTAVMKGKNELSIYKKYHNNATLSFHAAKEYFGFVRAGIEILEHEMFLS